MKDPGMIEDTTSPYASPTNLVRKPNGQYRLVIDFRKLKAQTIKPNFPLPIIDDVLEQIGGFIPRYATIAEPLTRLLKKESRFVWTEQCEAAFKKLKALLAVGHGAHTGAIRPNEGNRTPLRCKSGPI